MSQDSQDSQDSGSQFQFIKIAENTYKMKFEVKHPIFKESNNFNIIKNICLLVSGIVLHNEMTQTSDDICDVTIFYINIFESIGLPSRFSRNNVIKIKKGTKTFFLFKKNDDPVFAPTSVSLILDNTEIICDSSIETALFSVELKSELPEFIISILSTFCRQVITNTKKMIDKTFYTG